MDRIADGFGVESLIRSSHGSALSAEGEGLTRGGGPSYAPKTQEDDRPPIEAMIV